MAMFPSIFSDELGLDITKGLPIIRSWGLDHVDLRGRVFGKAAEALDPKQLPDVRKLLDDHGMKVGCLQSSLAKVHLPDAERQKAEADKLEGIIRAADALDCRLVRSFFYWQPSPELSGALAVRPDEQQKILDMFAPLADRAKEAGLILGFENCGVTPDEVLTIVDALDVPGWGLAWDCCNSWDCDERRDDPDAYIERLAKQSPMLHVKAMRAVPGLTEEVIPYDRVLEICNNLGVCGPVSAETHNPNRRVDNVEMSRSVVDVIQKAWPTAAPGLVIDRSERKQAVERPWADDPVGFAVVGLGMGHNRAKQIVATSGTRLVGVSDLLDERVSRTAEECGVPGTTDFREWLSNDDVEVVFVLTETGRHAEIGLQALEAGKHVMTTKPMDANVAACDALIRKAEEKGLLLAVDFDRRHLASVNGLKAAVAKGSLGRLLSGNMTLKILREMSYFQHNGGWRGTKRWDGGGVFSNQSIHHIDEIVYTVGVPAKVMANVWTQTHDIEAEDLGTAVWYFDCGLVLTLTATSSFPQPTWYMQYELTGETGAYCEAGGGPHDKARTKWFIDGTWQDKAPETVAPEWVNSMDNFAAALRTGAPLVCSGRDGRRSRAVLDAMYESAYGRDGGWVDVNADLG